MSKENRIKNIMTIDDDSVDQYMYKRLMSRSGLVENVITFQLASEALEFLKSDDSPHIEIILLDINMPRMDGFEFLERASAELGEKFALSVVVMLTTSLNPADIERANSFSMVKGYIDKPLTIEHLKDFAKG